VTHTNESPGFPGRFRGDAHPPVGGELFADVAYHNRQRGQRAGFDGELDPRTPDRTAEASPLVPDQ